MRRLNIEIAIAAMWVVTGAAVIVAVTVSRSIIPLGFLLIPLAGGISMQKEDDKNG